MCAEYRLQVEFVVAFLGIAWARAVAAPLNSNYKQVAHAFHLFGSSLSIAEGVLGDVSYHTVHRRHVP
jgi:acyl-CoA synthetase (AMP-forming)/AMP-acid ligase II